MKLLAAILCMLVWQSCFATPTGLSHAAYTRHVFRDDSEFSYPPDWPLDNFRGATRISSPGHEVFLYLIADTGDSNLEGRALKLWQQLKPHFSYPLRQKNRIWQERGFDFIEQFFYETPVGDQKIVMGIALSKHAKAHWILLEANIQALPRYGRDLDRIIASFSRAKQKDQKAWPVPKVGNTVLIPKPLP